MRKKGIIFLFVLFAIFIALFLIFTDQWLENQMEAIGSSVVGAKVEFEGVDFSFANLNMKWNRLQVTDPKDTWHNLFETGKTEFDMALEPLLSKKFVIDNIQLDSLKFNSKRETDGKLPEQPQKKSKVVQFIQEKIEQETSDMPVFNMNRYTKKVNVDSLWTMVELKSPQKIDSLKENYQNSFVKWEERIDNLPDKDKINQLQKQIESIKIDQIKTVNEFQSALTTANGVYSEIDSISKNFQNIKQNFQDDMQQIKANKNLVTNWADQDYRRVLNLAQIPDISVKNVAKLLFGNRVLRKLQEVTGYVGTARYYMSKVKSGKPEKKSPPRLEGQDIRFGSKKSLPKFWVKNLSLNGEILNGLNISGIVNDIVSDQKKIDKATEFKVGGTRRDKTSLNLTGTFNYTGDEPSEVFKLSLQQIPLTNMNLTDVPLLPSRIAQGKGTIFAEMNFEGDEFLADVKFNANHVQFAFNENTNQMNPRIAEFSRSIAQSINSIDFQATAKKVGKDLNFSIKSNLDNLIAGRVKQLISGEIEKARQELDQRVRQEVAKYGEQLQQLIVQKQKELTAQLKSFEETLKKNRSEIEKKRAEIEKRLEAEKKKLEKKLGDEAKKKLKDLLK